MFQSTVNYWIVAKYFRPDILHVLYCITQQQEVTNELTYVLVQVPELIVSQGDVQFQLQIDTLFVACCCKRFTGDKYYPWPTAPPPLTTTVSVTNSDHLFRWRGATRPPIVSNVSPYIPRHVCVLIVCYRTANTLFQCNVLHQPLVLIILPPQ